MIWFHSWFHVTRWISMVSKLALLQYDRIFFSLILLMLILVSIPLVMLLSLCSTVMSLSPPIKHPHWTSLLLICLEYDIPLTISKKSTVERVSGKVLTDALFSKMTSVRHRTWPLRRRSLDCYHTLLDASLRANFMNSHRVSIFLTRPVQLVYFSFSLVLMRLIATVSSWNR